MSDEIILEKMIKMAQQSLSPNQYEKYIRIHNYLIDTRNLKMEYIKY